MNNNININIIIINIINKVRRRESLQTKEEFASGGGLQHVGGRQAEHLHDAGKLFDLVLAGEQRIARVQLRDDAAEAPHVNRRRVRQTEDHLGSSVEPRLNVRVHCPRNPQAPVTQRRSQQFILGQGGLGCFLPYLVSFPFFAFPSLSTPCEIAPSNWGPERAL